MDWIETYDGYVRKDTIIDVHINSYYPGVVFISLINGDSIKYKDYNGDEAAAKLAMEELMDFLAGRGSTYMNKF